MIIQRYLFREAMITFLMVGSLLLAVFLSATLMRVLYKVTTGDYPVDILFSVFALLGIVNFSHLLPITFFIGVLLALGRLYQDSEMAALMACGIGPAHLLRTVGMVSAVVAIIEGIMALHIGPAASHRVTEILHEAGSRPLPEQLSAGVFNVIDDSLVYVERIDRGIGTMYGLYIHSREAGRLVVVTARQARTLDNPDTGLRYLVLEDGRRYDGNPGRADFKIMQFERYSILIRERGTAPPGNFSEKDMPFFQLWQSGDIRGIAELQWRLGGPVAILLLGLLAVPLSRTSPRQGRFGRVALGVVVYLLYTNLLTISRAWVANGKLAPEIGLWWVHLVVITITVVMLIRQSRLAAPKPPERIA